jgi:hypothetical protein
MITLFGQQCIINVILCDKSFMTRFSVRIFWITIALILVFELTHIRQGVLGAVHARIIDLLRGYGFDVFNLLHRPKGWRLFCIFLFVFINNFSLAYQLSMVVNEH